MTTQGLLPRSTMSSIESGLNAYDRKKLAKYQEACRNMKPIFNIMRGRRTFTQKLAGKEDLSSDFAQLA